MGNILKIEGKEIYNEEREGKKRQDNEKQKRKVTGSIRKNKRGKSKQKKTK